MDINVTTQTHTPDARAEALVASYERAGYARVTPPILQPAEPFLDLSGEVTWRIAGTNQAGFKAEIFNLMDNQEKDRIANVAWCGAASNATCTTAINSFGKATARTQFLLPRRFRFSLIYRF